MRTKNLQLQSQGLHLQEENQQGQRQCWSLHGHPEDSYTYLLKFLQRRWQLQRNASELKAEH
ncbi:hypothetical protein ACRRTK_004465 [Alexandromys fortis]